jgi:hypothetical protein
MKILITALVLIMTVAAQQSDDKEFDELYLNLSLDEKINLVQTHANDLDKSRRNKVMKVLGYHLASNYSTQWQNGPDSLEAIRDKMEKLRPLVANLATSDDYNERTDALQLLRYLHVDNETKKIAFNILEIDNQDQGQRNCYDALEIIFSYNFDTPELRQRLVQGLVDSEIRKKYHYTKGVELYAGKWRLTEATDNLLSNVLEYYKVNGHVRCPALTSLKELGHYARSALPQLKKLLDERRQDPRADFREIELLEHTIFLIEKPPAEHVQNNNTNSSSDTNSVKSSYFSSFYSSNRKTIILLFGVIFILCLWCFRNTIKNYCARW